MQNTSETSHPGNKQKSLRPWEASTGGEILWTRATAEKNVWERLVGPSLVGQTGTCDLLKDMISRKLPRLGMTPWRMESHVSQWLWLSLKKKPQKRSVALSSMSNTAYSPGLTSCDYFLTRWVFIR